MQHEAKVGQTFKLDLVLDIDLAEASRSDKLADTVGYDQVVDVASEAFCAQRYRLVEAAAGAVADAVLDRFPRSRACGSPCTSRMRRSPRPSTMSASRSCAPARRQWLRRCSRSAAMSATCATPSTAPSPRSATARTCACSPARPTTHAALGRRRTSRRSSICCIAVETGLTPHALLARAQEVERALGRDRAQRAPLGPAHRRHRPPRL